VVDEPAAVPDTLKAALDATARAVERLRVEADAAERWRRVLESVVADLPTAPAAVCETLTKQADVLREQESKDPQAVDELRQLYRGASERARGAAQRSVSSFATAAEAEGLEFDTSSRHPRYSLYDHAIDVELDERGLRATINVRHGDRIRMPLDIAPLVERLKAERDRLFERPWDPHAFVTSLAKAYKPLSKKQEKVPLRELAADMVKPKKPRLDEFAVDLGRFLRDPLAETGKHRVSVDQTRDTKNGLLLHGVQQSGYVLTLTMEDR
jgi:hypothetical protein